MVFLFFVACILATYIPFIINPSNGTKNYFLRDGISITFFANVLIIDMYNNI